MSEEITHKSRQENRCYYWYEGLKNSKLNNKSIKKTSYMTLISR